MSGLVRQNGLRSSFLAPVERELDEFFNSFFSPKTLSSVKNRVNYPKLNIWSKDNNLVVECAVPGIKSEDIKIEIQEGNDSFGNSRVLKISGNMNFSDERKDADYHIRELSSRHFERSITLPTDAVGDPEALLKDGILTLTWKTKPIEVKPAVKLIPIKIEN